MSNYNQIYTLINDAASDAMGAQAPRVKDTTGFVSLGKTLANVNKVDAFYGALATRIAKTVAFVRLYKRNSRKIVVDAQEFGAYVQKVYADLPSAVINHVYAASDGQNPPTITRYDPHGVTTTINISTLLYGVKGVWDIEVVRPRKQIREAFLSASALSAFIDALYIQIETAFEHDVEQLEALADATAIAASYQAGNCTNLLQVYNTENAASLTVSGCLNDADFLSWSAAKITEVQNNMKNLSTVFNVSSYPTFTPSENSVVEVLSLFANKMKFKLRSNTYHEDLVKLPGYNEVSFWQGSGTSYAFSDISKIKIKNSAINSGTEVEASGIVAFIRDTEAVKGYFSDREVWEDVNKRDGLTTHGEHAEKGYAVDAHANAWVFYIGA